MLSYTILSKKPAHFHRLTGLTLNEFAVVLDKFRSSWGGYLHTQKTKKRDRAFGAGMKPHLKTLEDKLLFILVYVRMYPLFFIQGILFGMAESNSCIWAHRLLPLLDEALGYAHVKPKRTRGRGLDELLEEFPELKELGLLADGVERPIRRPKKDERQTATYTGKKKRNTRKNIVITRPDTKRVMYLGKTQDGGMHDKKAMDEEALSIHHCRSPVHLGVDLGFLGLTVPGARVIMPTKKPRGKELTEIQKRQNTSFSRVRVRVEHAIAGVKRNKSVADTYRNIKDGTDDLFMSVACSLHNLRVAYRYSPT